jgi:putative protease
VDELSKISHREYCTGFYFDKPTENAQIFYKGGYYREWDIIAIVSTQSEGYLTVIQRNKFYDGDVLEVFGPGKKPFKIKVEGLQTVEGVLLESAPHAMMKVKFICEKKVSENSIIRKQRKLD